MNPRIKVGDELAFVWRAGRIEIHAVEKISKTGRITVDQFVLNPDLSIRGPFSWTRPRVYLPTEEYREQAAHQLAIRKLQAVKWGEKSLATLNAVLYILSDEKGGKA